MFSIGFDNIFSQQTGSLYIDLTCCVISTAGFRVSVLPFFIPFCLNTNLFFDAVDPHLCKCYTFMTRVSGPNPVSCKTDEPLPSEKCFGFLSGKSRNPIIPFLLIILPRLPVYKLTGPGTFHQIQLQLTGERHTLQIKKSLP